MKTNNSCVGTGRRQSGAFLSIPLLFAVLILESLSAAQKHRQTELGMKAEHPIVKKVQQIYTSQIGIREKGTNSVPEVDQYLRYVNLPKGNPWCAAFVCWVYGRAGIGNPRTGWSPALFPDNKVVWERAESGKRSAEGLAREPETKSQESRLPQNVSGSYPTSLATGNRKQATDRRQPATPTTGDIFGLYFPEKKRIAHVGFIDFWDGNWLITVEGNTNDSGSREGHGVYKKRRMVKSIYKVARYINDARPLSQPKGLTAPPRPHGVYPGGLGREVRYIPNAAQSEWLF